MTYLLDVNALIALGFINHEFHDRVAAWVRAEKSATLASCPISELGFVRVLAQAPAYGFTVTQARSLLLRLKAAKPRGLVFIPDQNDISHLPTWVKTPKQVADGHLCNLARDHGSVLATLDESVPGSYLIPK